MLKEAYHPNAFLSNIKNIKLGLQARTRILNALDKRPVDAKTLSNETGCITKLFYIISDFWKWKELLKENEANQMFGRLQDLDKSVCQI